MLPFFLPELRRKKSPKVLGDQSVSRKKVVHRSVKQREVGIIVVHSELARGIMHRVF